MSEPVSARELREHLADYLQAAQRGESFVVTSHRRPVARLIAPEAAPEGMPEISGVRWARGKRPLSKPLAARPANTGTAMSDWIVENRQ